MAGAIRKSRDKIVLREKRHSRAGLSEAFDILASMPMDAFKDIKEKRPPQGRKGSVMARRWAK